MPSTKKIKPQQPQQFAERTVPRSALIAELGRFTLGDTQDNLTPFSMLGRSTKPVKHWYYGDIYHDFSGMDVADSIPVDYCHDEQAILGYADKFNVDSDGLHLSGNFVHHHEGDRVDDVVHKGRNNVPYQASIDFRGDDIVAEEVGSGFQAQVNNQTVEGPALIFRKWPLIGIAVCPHGRDKNTRTQFSQDDTDTTVIRIFSTGAAVPQEDSQAQNDTTEQQQSEHSSDTQTGDTAEEQQPQKQQSADQTKSDEDPVKQYKEKLNRFVTQFGPENGLKWLDEGKSYTEAMEAHQQLLQQQLAAAQKESEQYKDKLEALKGGEEFPAQQNTDSDSPDDTNGPANRFAHLGRGKGAFASSLKIKQ